MRLTADEKIALGDRADEAGLTLSEYGRKLVLQALSPSLDNRTQELLRIMAEIVQQNLLLAVQAKREITTKTIQDLEGAAAGHAPDVLGRRLHLLEKAAGPQEL